VIDETPLSAVTNVYEQMTTFGAAVNPYLVSSREMRYDLAGETGATHRHGPAGGILVTSALQI